MNTLKVSISVYYTVLLFPCENRKFLSTLSSEHILISLLRLYLYLKTEENLDSEDIFVPKFVSVSECHTKSTTKSIFDFSQFI